MFVPTRDIQTFPFGRFQSEDQSVFPESWPLESTVQMETSTP
jgi:hypothetical protein